MIAEKKNKLPSLAVAPAAWLWIACLAMPSTSAQTNAAAPAKPARVRAKLDGFDISAKTVENHKHRIFCKLGVHNQAHAVSIAMRAERIRPSQWPRAIYPAGP